MFAWPLWEKFLESFLQNGAFWCIFVLLSDGETPNVAGPGVAYPIPHPLDELALYRP